MCVIVLKIFNQMKYKTQTQIDFYFCLLTDICLVNIIFLNYNNLKVDEYLAYFKVRCRNGILIGSQPVYQCLWPWAKPSHAH
jgi:hypothetical protein